MRPVTDSSQHLRGHQSAVKEGCVGANEASCGGHCDVVVEVTAKGCLGSKST